VILRIADEVPCETGVPVRGNPDSDRSGNGLLSIPLLPVLASIGEVHLRSRPRLTIAT
jgi:hypothetical protein